MHPSLYPPKRGALLAALSVLLCAGRLLAAPLSVNIVSEPPGAIVYIDGKGRGARGVATETLRLHLEPGAHTVLLELPGFQPLEQAITVTSPKERFAFTMQAAMEQLAVRSAGSADEARGGQVFIDGVAVGTVPADVELRQGTHQVEVRKPGYKLHHEQVTLQATEKKTVLVALAREVSPAPASIAAEVRPPPAPEPPPQGAKDGSEVAALREQLAALRRTVDEVQRQLGPAAGARANANMPGLLRPTAEMPASAMPGSVAPGASFLAGLRINASVTLRYDWTVIEDQTDQYLEPNQLWNAFRTRVRLGISYDNEGPVTGGVRIALGQTPNPAGSFVSLGDVARPKSIGFDQFYGTVRPLADRDRLGLTFGKMPNPLWRGDRGTVRDELIWDDDINPEGLSLHATFFRIGGTRAAPRFKLENTLAFFVLNNLQPLNFSGLTGTSYVVAEQLHFTAPFLKAALSYNDYENLNNGLVSPGLVTGGAFPLSGQSAYLLRPGTQNTNNHVNYGPSADGFLIDAYRVGSALVQINLPLTRLKSLGQPDLFVLGNYTRNFAAARDAGAYGVTLGLRAGDYNSRLHPLNLWFTWRDVDADATLATFADSDLGGGTAFRGLEFGANYRVFRNLLTQVSYYDYQAFPNKDSRVQRLFLDLVADF